MLALLRMAPNLLNVGFVPLHCWVLCFLKKHHYTFHVVTHKAQNHRYHAMVHCVRLGKGWLAFVSMGIQGAVQWCWGLVQKSTSFLPSSSGKEFEEEESVGTVGCKSLSWGRCTPNNHQDGWMDRHLMNGYVVWCNLMWQPKTKCLGFTQQLFCPCATWQCHSIANSWCRGWIHPSWVHSHTAGYGWGVA
jgi:hypothetical protein